MISVPLTGQGIEEIELNLADIDTDNWQAVTYAGNAGYLLEVNFPVPDLVSLHLAHDSLVAETPVLMLESNRSLGTNNIDDIYRTSLDADGLEQSQSIGNATNKAFMVTPDIFRFNHMGIFVQTAAVSGKVIIYPKFK